MTITRRTTDNPLGLIKDDILLALQHIRMDLESCQNHSAGEFALETMHDAIAQIHSPLLKLGHADAAAVLDAMRIAVDDVTCCVTPEQIPLLQEAVQQLTSYVQTELTPGHRPTNTAPLIAIAAALHQAHPGCSTHSGRLEASLHGSQLHQMLARLQQTLAENLEAAPASTISWSALQQDLAALRQLSSASATQRPLLMLDRLRRIIGVLVGGAPEHYGVLVGGVCAEILAGLPYMLERTGATDSTVAARLFSEVEEQLGQLETLLDLPAELAVPPKPAAASTPMSLASRQFKLDALPAAVQKKAVPATAYDADAPTKLVMHTPELLLSASATSTSDSAGGGMQDLLTLIGVDDTDPEFAEVFLEEARGELSAVREQLDVWRNDLTNRQALTVVRRAFHTLKGSGRMVNALVIGDFAWELEALLNQALDGSLPVSHQFVDLIAAAVAALEPLVGACERTYTELSTVAALTAQAQALPSSIVSASEHHPVTPAAPQPQPQPQPSSPQTDIAVSPLVFTEDADPEFVEVFLEEAQGELLTIRHTLPLWRADFADHQSLTNLRRAFHTLKGSGRVVGTPVIGDFAWEFENLLNHVLSGTLTATPTTADLIDEATVLIEGLLSTGNAAGQALQQLPALVAHVRALLEVVPAEVAVEAPMPATPLPPVADLELAPAPALTAPEEITLGALQASSLDVEMAQVFQYEAAEILDASDVILQGLAAEPENTSLLNDLRRGMHTLKGSSRMAGIMTVGDLAHASESVLDALGRGLGQVTAALLDTLQHVLDQLNRMLGEAANGVQPQAAVELIDDLRHLTEEMTQGALSGTMPKPSSTPGLAAAEAPAAQAMTELDQELVQLFQVEAGEILDSSDTLLLRLRDDLDNVELLNDLRREMHTLKGSSRMAGFMTVGDVAHATESVLDALGKGSLQMSAPVLEQIQGALDQLHQMFAGVASGQQPAARPEIIERLGTVLGTASAVAPATPPIATAPTQTPTVVATTAPTSTSATPAAPPLRSVESLQPAATSAPADTIRVSASLLNTLVNQMGESSIFRARIDQGVGAMSHNLNDLEQTIARLRRQVMQLANQAEARIQSRQDQSTKAHQEEFDPLELDRFTELQQLSRSLMEIGDDLGNIGTTMGEHAREVTSLLDQQSKINKEIQQGLMRTGMVRFGTIIPRLRRVVRQAAQDLGKRAEMLVGGEDAEVDRTVLENIQAPLEHMLRNSLAHGIETPEKRREAGKSEIGTISLSLRREGAELVLELGDDGAGLNFAAIRTKGEEKGFLLPGQPATQDELIALLLRPGFSTATTITQVSGRGVGMDVVSEAIRAMRGALLIQTEPGKGSRFIIRLPFSLAVTQALLVQAGDGLFAIPLLSIEVVTRLSEADFKAYLGGEMVRHEHSKRHYPVHSLGILVGSEQVVPFEEVTDRRPPTLLFRSAEASAAIQVEAVQGNQEIIVKPVSPQFNAVPGISGATVLGDGRVVVVLELAALVRTIGSQRQKQLESRALRAARQEARPEKLTIMVIDDSITMRKVTARVLERHNITAITAKDGLDAVAMLQTQVPDLAILDIEMPRMDGFEVVAHVRNQAALRHLPIIMVTSRGGDKHRERAMHLGVNDYLTKPYQEDQLMDSIRNILGEHALDLMT